MPGVTQPVWDAPIPESALLVVRDAVGSMGWPWDSGVPVLPRGVVLRLARPEQPPAQDPQGFPLFSPKAPALQTPQHAEAAVRDLWVVLASRTCAVLQV